MSSPNLPEKLSNFVLFKTADGKVNIDVYFYNETLWLSQKLLAELFQKDRSVISRHLKKIFEEGELDEQVVCAKFALTTQHGAVQGKTQEKDVLYYNLRAITAVGYRVNSHRATEFRKWATEILHEYIVKGFVMDDERLKAMKHFGQDYFEELLERIREIRLSERRLYQKVTDIYALSADYDKNDPTTQEFFATVQNKMHWAIQGKTAAEIIYTEADVTIAKNYLDHEHLKELERIVSAYLDLAENRARRGIVTNMKDWVRFLDKFLAISDYPILVDKGSISALEAKIKAEAEYDKFRIIQDREYVSDFDEKISKLIGKHLGGTHDEH